MSEPLIQDKIADMSCAPRPSLPARSSSSLLWRLWRDYLSRYSTRLLLAFAAMIVLAITVSLIPMVIEAINAAILPERAHRTSERGFSPSLDQLITLGPIILPLIGLVYAAAQYTQSRLSLGAALDTLRDIQQALFAHFTKLDLAQQRTEQSGAIASRFTNDIQILRESLTRSTNGVRDLLQAVGLLAVMVWYDALLFAAIIGVYALVGWPIALLGKRLRTRARQAQETTADLSANLVQQVTGAAMVKSYGLEDHQRARLGALFETRNERLKQSAFLRAMNEPLVFLVGTIAIGVVVMIIGLRIKDGALDAPAVAGFIVALLLLSQPARGLSTLFAVLQEGLAAFSRITAILDQTPTLDANETGNEASSALTVSAGQIIFDAVTFAYDGAAPALDSINLEIKGGQTTALIGESGAGKTTMLALLARFYDPDMGQIVIDGQAIAACSLSSVRQQTALVSQEPVLFNDTIANNIAFGRLGAERADIEQAARAAYADEFITQLPHGYDTILGEAGNTLSGGQRQRVAIARAFLKDAPILLLDEPTAALDAESEAAIQQALNALTKGRTTLIVAHRLTTIQHADLIVVMDKGRIIETGTHATLMEKAGAYARFLALQSRS